MPEHGTRNVKLALSAGDTARDKSTDETNVDRVEIKASTLIVT